MAAGERVDFLHVVTSGEAEVGGRVLGTGDCAGEVSFLTGAGAEAEVLARTRVRLASFPRLRLGELLRRHPCLQRHLAALVTRTTAPEGDSEFRGSLSALSFPDVVQYLQMSRRSGRLRLRRQGESGGGGEFTAVEAVHAWAGGLEGESAFRALAGWKGAAFDFESGPPGGSVSIATPTSRLLLEALREAPEPARAG